MYVDLKSKLIYVPILTFSHNIKNKQKIDGADLQNIFSVFKLHFNILCKYMYNIYLSVN